MNVMAKTFIISGVCLIVIGLFFALSDKLPWIGRLPGDIHVRKEGFSFHFPLVTCILISLILTVLFNFFGRK